MGQGEAGLHTSDAASLTANPENMVTGERMNIKYWPPWKNVIQCLHISTISGKSVVEVSVREIIVSKFIFVVLLWDQLCDFEQYSRKLPSSCQWTWRKGSEGNKYTEETLGWRVSPHAGARWAGCWCPRRWWPGQCPRSPGSTSPPHTPPALGTCGQPGTVTDANISWLSNVDSFTENDACYKVTILSQ